MLARFQKEQQAIEQYKASLSDSELNSVLEFAAELKRQQVTPDSPKAVATIPTITLKDIEPKTRDDYPILVEDNAFDTGITVVKHDLPSTVGIAYLDFLIDISGLDLSDVEFFLPLFTGMMTKTGTKDLSDKVLSQEIGMHTGGVSVSTLVSPVRKEGTNENVVHDGVHFVTKLMIKGEILHRSFLWPVIGCSSHPCFLFSSQKVNQQQKRPKSSSLFFDLFLLNQILTLKTKQLR